MSATQGRLIVGGLAELRADFTNLAGAPTDPTTVTLKIKKPDGSVVTLTTPTVVNDTTVLGGFYYDLTLDQAGEYTFLFEGAGAVQALDWESFIVEPNPFVGTQPIIASEVCGLWASEADVLSCCTPPVGADLTNHLWRASELLYILTGRQWRGVCTMASYRPPGCGIAGTRYGYGYGYGGWEGYGFLTSPNSYLSRIDLWKATNREPIQAVGEVVIDGAIVDPATYRLDENRWLTRLADSNGVRQLWPQWQWLDRPDTAIGTFRIGPLTYGLVPPISGKLHAARLACEFAKACSTNADDQEACQLSAQVKTVVRQGVTYDIVPVAEQVGTNIPEIDKWVAAVNPKKLQASGRMVRPDWVLNRGPRG
jgi:hypothetical protein